jgi:hypothetical protein
VSHPIRRLHDLAECCVFGKQSVDPFHCDPLLSASSRKEIRISNFETFLFVSSFDIRASSFVLFAGGKKEGAPLLPKLRG